MFTPDVFLIDHYQGVAKCFDRYVGSLRRTLLMLILLYSLDGFFPALEAGEIKPGMVLIFRYQGPKGAPGMPEMLGRIYPN